VFNWISGLLAALFKVFLQPRASQEAIVSREAATAETTLASHVEMENALAKANAVAVANANAAIMRSGDTVTTDPGAAVNRDPDAHFRD
jgi:hypothetical protein